MSATLPGDLVTALTGARSIAVLTGAGCSAESGIPTFRDAMDGLWAKYNPEDLATPEAFARNPEGVTRWYDERRVACGRARPHAGHWALAELQNGCEAQGRRFRLITQNVDRLHQLAGSHDVVELHGSLWTWRCVTCGKEREYRGPAMPHYPPMCRCGGLLRPGVVWFGEVLPVDGLTAAEEAARTCDFFFSIGTSAQVYPAADLIHVARDSGARTIEINPEPTAHSAGVDWYLPGRAGDILPGLVLAVGISAANLPNAAPGNTPA